MSTEAAAAKAATASNGNGQVAPKSITKAAPKRAAKSPQKTSVKTSVKEAAKAGVQLSKAEFEKLTGELANAVEDLALQNKQLEAMTAETEELKTALQKRTPINVADALVKASDINAISDRLEFLYKTRKELSAFALGSDGTREELCLSDGSGNEFTSHNTSTIKLVLNTLKTELDQMILDTEKELLAAA